MRLGVIVEGHGEVEAVPIVVRRLVERLSPGRLVEIPRPMRVPRGKLAKKAELSRAVELMARKAGADGPVLVVLDADQECPAELGRRLLGWAVARRSDRKIAVVVAKQEFEAWSRPQGLQQGPAAKKSRLQGLQQGPAEKNRVCKAFGRVRPKKIASARLAAGPGRKKIASARLAAGPGRKKSRLQGFREGPAAAQGLLQGLQERLRRKKSRLQARSRPRLTRGWRWATLGSGFDPARFFEGGGAGEMWRSRGGEGES